MKATSKPTFLWQPILILLPLALLAAVGVHALRQDIRLARQEAVSRARDVADDLLASFLNPLTNTASGLLGPVGFETDSQGGLVQPMSFASPPEPAPLDMGRLTPQQQRLWQECRSIELRDSAGGEAVQKWREFLATQPEERFAALGRYGLGLALENSGERTEAIEVMRSALADHPSAMTESGLPLASLLRFRLFSNLNGETDTAARRAEMEALCSKFVERPSMLTPFLLHQLALQSISAEEANTVLEWRRRWEQDELARSLHARARARTTTEKTFQPVSIPAQETVVSPLPPALWVEAPNSAAIGTNELSGQWLLFRVSESGERRRFLCQSDLRLSSAAGEVVRNARRIPDYFGVRIDLAGKTLSHPDLDLHLWKPMPYMSRSGGGLRQQTSDELSTNLLASATWDYGGVEGLDVGVYLTSPESLFQDQRTRRFWFGSLIALSAVAALIGLLAAYRAFSRQLWLSEMKSNFVASVSHELRAPIASVRLMAENLESGKIPDPGKQQEYFGFISRECRRLSSLIENVLDFSRIDRGRRQYDFEPADLSALMENTCRLMGGPASERGISLAANLPFRQDAVLVANVDAKALQQALINLVDNALKHSPAGSQVVLGLAVSEAPSAANGGSASVIQFWVEDKGEGIPAEEQEKIFERFYRRGSELRRSTEGVGIGLSIVKHIAEAHGGRVLVKSAVGEGSRFTIELPGSRSQAATGTALARPADQGKAPS